MFQQFLDKIVVVIVFGLVLATVLTVAMLKPSMAQENEEPTTTAAVNPASVGEFRGVWLQVHNNDPTCPFEEYIREIAKTGANTVCLSISAFQENASSSVMFVTQDLAPSRERLTGLIRLAKDELKMRVILMPIVLFANPGAGEWRGKIKPDSWDTWWQNYTKYIVDYARLARELDVDLYMVGSELISTEKEDARWRELIGKVRQVDREYLDWHFAAYLYKTMPGLSDGQIAGKFGLKSLSELTPSRLQQGNLAPALKELLDKYRNEERMLLSYSSNWDHYEVPTWWDALDAVGMTSYYDINPDKQEDPSVPYLIEQWKPIRDHIANWQRRIGRPILFTEVGWASQDGCSIYPWNYYHSTKVDLAEQANCTQSFLDVFGQEQWVSGILVWKWRDHPGMAGGKEDYGYTPFNKPAMKFIQDYFRSPSRLATTIPADGAATAPAAMSARQRAPGDAAD